MIVEFKGWIEVDAEDVDSSWDLEQAIRDEGYEKLRLEYSVYSKKGEPS